jgi:hypothetical protein
MNYFDIVSTIAVIAAFLLMLTDVARLLLNLSRPLALIILAVLIGLPLYSSYRFSGQRDVMQLVAPIVVLTVLILLLTPLAFVFLLRRENDMLHRTLRAGARILIYIATSIPFLPLFRIELHSKIFYASGPLLAIGFLLELLAWIGSRSPAFASFSSPMTSPVTDRFRNAIMQALAAAFAFIGLVAALLETIDSHIYRLSR